MGNFECGNICKKNNNFIYLSKETNLKKKISIKNEENENSIMSMNNENSSEKNSENNNLTNINYKFLK